MLRFLVKPYKKIGELKQMKKEKQSTIKLSKLDQLLESDWDLWETCRFLGCRV